MTETWQLQRGQVCPRQAVKTTYIMYNIRKRHHRKCLCPMGVANATPKSTRWSRLPQFDHHASHTVLDEDCTKPIPAYVHVKHRYHIERLDHANLSPVHRSRAANGKVALLVCWWWNHWACWSEDTKVDQPSDAIELGIDGMNDERICGISVRWLRLQDHEAWDWLN